MTENEKITSYLQQTENLTVTTPATANAHVAKFQSSNNSIVPLGTSLGTMTDETLPTFSDKIKTKQWPLFIQKILARYPEPKDPTLHDYHKRHLDIIILTVLTLVGVTFPNTRFKYRKNWLHPILLSVVVAAAGMGKGVMDELFELIAPIHEKFKKEYERLLALYNAQQHKLKMMSKKEMKEFPDSELMEKPAHHFFRLPGDSTYASFLKSLVTMGGTGLILETEIDVLVRAFSSDIGDFSVLLRKDFHHETHSFYRKTDDEYYEIENPAFSMAISGTLDQCLSLIPDAANGLFSRLSIYLFNISPRWIDAEIDETEESDKEYFRRLGNELLENYNLLSQFDTPVRFSITKQQLKRLNKTFSQLHLNFLDTEGEGIHATIVRLATILQRIAMTLTLLETLELSPEERRRQYTEGLVCSNKNFDLAWQIAFVLLQHTTVYYELIQSISGTSDDISDTKPITNTKIEQAFGQIPANVELTRQQILDVFTSTGTPTSTAIKYITKYIKTLRLNRIRKNIYVKNPEQTTKTKKAS